MSQRPTSQKCKILFVDDSHTEINYLKLLFQVTELPADPIFINSAHQALDTLKETDVADFPQFILVDINMPLMDGFEFASRYLELFKSTNPSTKLFLYSTSIHSKDVLRAKSIEGVSGFISKPFSEATFNNEIKPHIPVSLLT